MVHRLRNLVKEFWRIISNPAVGGIISVAFVAMFGLGIVLPIVPLYARSLGASLAAAGTFTSLYGLTRLAMDVSGGRLTDRFGVRNATVGGMLLFALGPLLTGLADSYATAIAAWALTGIGSAIFFAGLYAYLLKTVAKSEMARVMGLFYGSFNVGIIAGGPVGGLLAGHFGLDSPFYVYAALLVASALVYVRFVQAPPRVQRSSDDPPPATFLQALKVLGRKRGFVLACLSSLAYLWLIAGTFDLLVPLKARLDLGMSTIGIGGLFGAATAAELITLYPAGALADKLGRVKVLLPSTAAMAVLAIVSGFAPSVAWFTILLCILCLATGFAGVPGSAMMSDVVPDELSGTAVGIFRFTGDLGFVFGPLLAGWVAESAGFPAAFATCAIPCVAVVIVGLGTPETLGVTLEGDEAVAPQMGMARGGAGKNGS